MKGSSNPDSASGTEGTAPEHETLLELLSAILALAPDPAPPERKPLDLLRELRGRLAEGQFQIAVVGQFKRGKSSLLNALLGLPVLPSGVLPLTAIPAFIRHDDTPSLDVTFVDHPEQRWSGTTITALRETLGEFVTEAGNPHNRKQVRRVRIGLPAPLLADGLVLIDTPGIGSAARHNSETALAALPQCDAALVVLSPDPPVTEVEIAYLEEVRRHAALILPVLNKIDLVEGNDRTASIAYLAGVLDQLGISEPVIPVSATRALSDEPGLADNSGIAALQARITAISGTERQRALHAAIARKAGSAVDELRFQNDVALAALTMPLDRLDAGIALLRQATATLSDERSAIGDMLAGESRRVMDGIELSAAELRGHARQELLAVLADVTTSDAMGDSGFTTIAERIGTLFAAAYPVEVETQRRRLEEIASRAQARMEPLLVEVRTVASEALAIPFHPPHTEIGLSVRPSLSWSQRAAETMNPLPAGVIDRLLPASWRLRRVRARLLREIDRLVAVNVEHLRWELRQSVSDALRRFRLDLETAIDEAGRSVTAMVEDVRSVRGHAGTEAAAEVAARSTRTAMLGRFRAALDRWD